MCGIAGVLHLNGPGHISVDDVKKMIGALAHRGPDESGVYLDGWIGLGHARLSTVDLSTGTQPIHNEDESLWIAGNGEIFNYPELRRSLLGKGHHFSTSTDTEVALHLYEEMGSQCVHHLNGQFALAIWDAQARRLWLARDRMGVRPLHYALHNGDFVFASEIKAIFTREDIPREIDPVALDQVFTFWTTCGSRTSFKDIYELPPGCHLTVSGGKAEVQRYWDAPFFPPDQYLKWSVELLAERTRELLRDSVRIRLRGDVPAGCYLSGGLDSSGIGALTQLECGGKPKTYGIGFEEAPFDEGKQQDKAALLLGTDHTQLVVDNEAIGSAFREVIWHCEKPLLRTAPVPLYLLSDLVRENGLKVVLTGEGGDEVFGGYEIFREAKVRAYWARQPGSSRRPLLLRRLYPYVFGGDTRARGSLAPFFGRGLEEAHSPLFSHLIRWHNTSRIKQFFSEALKAQIGDYSGYDDLIGALPAEFGDWEVVSKAQYLEMKTLLNGYLLSSQGDRPAMAHGVEIRTPYLDHRLVEFMGRVPPKWKIRGLEAKYLLRKAYDQVLPSVITQLPKRPYRAPIRECLLHPQVQEGYEELLSERNIREAGLFSGPRVQSLLRKLRDVPRPSEVDNMALAGIVSAQCLHEQFVSCFPLKTPRAGSPTFVADRRPGVREMACNVRQ